MAQIEVRANKLVEGTDVTKEPSHLVIVVTDDNGNSTFFRGGPGVNREDLLGVTFENPWGQVITDSGPYVDGSIDWNPEATVLYRETIPQSEVQSVLKQFQEQLDDIQAAGYVYDPTPNGRGDGNSNSVVGTLMRNVRGHDLDVSNWVSGFGDGVTAPGENIQLVDRQGNRVASAESIEVRFAQAVNDSLDSSHALHLAPENAVDEAIQAGMWAVLQHDSAVSNETLMILAEAALDELQPQQQPVVATPVEQATLA